MKLKKGDIVKVDFGFRDYKFKYDIITCIKPCDAQLCEMKNTGECGKCVYLKYNSEERCHGYNKTYVVKKCPEEELKKAKRYIEKIEQRKVEEAL